MESIDHLLRRPLGGRMLGDIEMNDTATLVAKDDEDEQNSRVTGDGQSECHSKGRWSPSLLHSTRRCLSRSARDGYGTSHQLTPIPLSRADADPRNVLHEDDPSILVAGSSLISRSSSLWKGQAFRCAPRRWRYSPAWVRRRRRGGAPYRCRRRSRASSPRSPMASLAAGESHTGPQAPFMYGTSIMDFTCPISYLPGGPVG